MPRTRDVALGVLCVALVCGSVLGGAAGDANAATAQGGGHAHPPATTGPEDRAALEELIDDLARGHVGHTTPGAMIAVVDADGPLVLDARGQADPMRGVPLTVDSRTPVASVSKVVTALTALSLHHQGSLDLDAEIGSLAGVTLRDRRAPAARTPVTGRHLLTHHSGLEEPLLLHPDPPDDANQVARSLRSWLDEHPPTLRHPADVGLHYSPLQGYTLIGAAIEQATGRPFDQAAREHVLEPVGARDAGFGATEPADGDVVLTAPDDTGWTASPWPAVHEAPSASLTWSTRDAAALLHALLADNGRLSPEVVAEATTTAVRPAHGGDGHTQVFFETWREGVRVLEHAGGNGVAWLALLPEAGLGVFAAVTSDTADAMPFAPAVVDAVARWAVATGRVAAAPEPQAGRPTVVPPWAGDLAPAVPVGTFHERLFAGRGPELALRSLTGQVTVTRDGEDLLLGERRFAPAAPGRWCDPHGCIAGVRSADGAVFLLRGDRKMLEQTLAPAPWWARRGFTVTALAGVLVLSVAAVCAVVRARARGRRGTAARASRRLGLAWVLLAVGVAVAAPMMALSPLVTGGAWVPAGGAAVWVLRLATAAGLAVGVGWAVTVVVRWRGAGAPRRVAAVAAFLAGAIAQLTLLTWALPS
ncbi:serine hydrolase domain-containing protein [Marinactinospora thermotolerans]|uniref:CubicO group peptidase, beta-lactamase class C family n=2 Tax=Marinactinospora thermotolerans TaxID=531310 RepID=A0A1T4SLX4_9ACTN|nr:serine hydrolase domain-containing protein [Marinactinospora thermotolerans]AGL76718.1 beta-lactamase [Marinactinospora thermotolerans]SKA29197.1 CubicO group peptidase, beta-lactamase class C family [Marinactinospora thermotolerans DSM 45154]